MTGVRRCGKSTLLKQFPRVSEKLRCGGERQIISINFEDVSNGPLMDYKALHDFVVKQLIPGKMTYYFSTKCRRYRSIESSRFSVHQNDVDLYITGSNAYLLSGELATFFPAGL